MHHILTDRVYKNWQHEFKTDTSWTNKDRNDTNGTTHLHCRGCLVITSTTSSLAISSRTLTSHTVRGLSPLSLKKGMVGSYSTPKDVQTSKTSTFFFLKVSCSWQLFHSLEFLEFFCGKRSNEWTEGLDLEHGLAEHFLFTGTRERSLLREPRSEEENRNEALSDWRDWERERPR